MGPRHVTDGVRNQARPDTRIRKGCYWLPAIRLKAIPD